MRILPILLIVLAVWFWVEPVDKMPQKIMELEEIQDQVTSEIKQIGETVDDGIFSGEEDEDPAQIDESSRIYYYFNNLNEEERAVYTKIVNGFYQMDTNIKIRIDQDRLWKIVRMVLADHPEIFWTEGAYQFINYGSSIVLQPDYNCNASVKKQREQEIENEMVQALEQIQTGTSQYEYVKNIFCYLIDTVDYVADAPDDQNIYSSLVNKRTVCAGYAKATQYLLQRMGITALYVTGSVVDRGDHAWNIVQCDGEYYQVDTTFGDPNFIDYNAEQIETLPDEFLHDYYYLCCNDEMMYRDRTVDTELPVPVCSSAAYDYYERNNACFDYYSPDIAADLIDSIINGKHYWFGRFSNQEAYQQMFSEVQNGLYARLVAENSGEVVSGVRTYVSYRDETGVIRLWY